MNPEILILDEPTAGLDPIGREEILKNIYEIHKKNKNTTILVSHSMDEIATYVNRLLVINDGQIYFDDVPKNVFKKVDELEKIGLSAPQISYLIKKLNGLGLNLSEEIITIEEVKEALLEILKGKYKIDVKRHNAGSVLSD